MYNIKKKVFLKCILFFFLEIILPNAGPKGYRVLFLPKL